MTTETVAPNRYTFFWIRETCCDYCGEVIHSHFDCPACGAEGVGSDYVSEPADEEIGNSFTCDDCLARYVLVDTSAEWCDDWVWERDLTAPLRPEHLRHPRYVDKVTRSAV